MKKELIEKIKTHVEFTERLKNSPALMSIVQEEVKKNREEMLKDYVYLIYCEGFYKIGISGNLKSRMSQINSSTPFNIEFITAKKFKDAKSIETQLHHLFEDKRVKGEWFSLNEDELKILADIFHESQ